MERNGALGADLIDSDVVAASGSGVSEPDKVAAPAAEPINARRDRVAISFSSFDGPVFWEMAEIVAVP